jgi:endonuclease/exonuclease/phosphatase family metal-dependent hydrolase
MRRSLFTLLLVLFWAIAAAAQTITVTTANLQHGEGTDSVTNYSRQITKLVANSPDLIAVQERTTGETAWDAPMAAAGLAQAVYQENDSNQGDGPAIWYKTSTVTINQTYFTNLQTTNLVGWDGSTTVNKAAVAAKVTVGGKQFYFVSTHLCWSACADSNGSQFSIQRVGQIKTLLAWINTTLTGGLDVVIAADFNYSPEYPRESAFSADPTTNILTVTAHGWANGAPVTVRNNGGTLSGGLTAGTQYYVRDATTNTIKLATTPGGTAVDVTSAGSGTNFVAGFQRDLFTSAGFADEWVVGIARGTATTPWGDRDADGIVDMTPSDIGTQTSGTRTHDRRRIDSIYILRQAGRLALQSITVPDSRATCTTTLTTTGTFKECPDVNSSYLQDVTDDQGVRPSDHNFMTATFSSGPAASLSCPSTAFVGQVVVCDGSGSTGVNGQNGWSTKSFTDGTSPVAMDFGDNQGPYSRAELLKSPHVYLEAGTYQVTLTVQDQYGAMTTATPQSIVVSAIPNAAAGQILTLTEQGSPSLNMSALQTMVNTAFGGNTVPWEIRITNGLQLTGQIFPPAAQGNSYVTIRPTDITWMPNGLQRVTPLLAANMPKFTAPFGNGSPIVVAGVGRKYLHVIGMEFNKPQGLIMNSLVMLGSDGSSNPAQYADLPDHLIFDRCYFHGNATDDTTRGILLYGNDVTIMNSYFKDFHDPGSDSQTMAMIEGRRVAYINNYAEAYGENIMLGGGGTAIRFSATASSGTSTSATLSSVANLSVGDGISFMVAGNRGPWTASIVRSISGSNITFDQITNAASTPTAPDTTAGAVKYGNSPQDIFIARNHFYKDTAFRVGAPNYNGHFAVVKNSFELKHAMRVIAVGNVIENMWGNQGQDGHTVLFTPRNQTCYLVTLPHDPTTCPEQTNPWTMVRDVQFSHTRVKNIPDFFNILGTDNLNPPGTGDESGPSAYTQHINVRETIVEGADPAATGAGQLAFLWPCSKNVTFSHITQVNAAGGAWVGSSDAACTFSEYVLLVNNIGSYNDYGLIGDGLQGDSFIAHFFPDGFVRYNVLTDDKNGKDGTSFTAPRGAPNYFPATINSSIFVNLAGGDLHVSPTSPFKAGGATPAADGRDMGTNFDDVATATANVASGNWSTGGTALPGSGGVKGKGKITGKGKIK